MAISDNALRSKARLIEIWFVGGKPGQAGLSIGDYCHQGLVYLVGNRRREFTHRGKARDTRQISLSVPQGIFTAALIGHVDQHADVLEGLRTYFFDRA
jgi:hypothetical protein